MKRYLNHDDDFQIIQGKKVLKDNRVYRAKMLTMDAAPGAGSKQRNFYQYRAPYYGRTTTRFTIHAPSLAASRAGPPQSVR